jgi:hypothetical protein
MMDRERGQGVHGMVVWFLVSSGQVYNEKGMWHLILKVLSQC